MGRLLRAVSQKLKGVGSLYLVATLIGGVGVEPHGVTDMTFDLAVVTLSLKILSGL